MGLQALEIHLRGNNPKQPSNMGQHAPSEEGGQNQSLESECGVAGVLVERVEVAGHADESGVGQREGAGVRVTAPP